MKRPKSFRRVGKSVRKYQPIIAAGIIATVVFAVAVFVVFNLPDTYITNNPPSGDGGGNQQQAPDIHIDFPTPAPADTSKAPTGSITVDVSPSPSTIGGYVTFSVTTNGKDYPITGYGKHVGAGTTQTMDGRLNDQGRFYYGKTIDVAGYWDFWAVSNGITSNVFRLQVQGCSMSMAKDRFSRLLGDMSTTVQIFSHFTGNAQVFAKNEATGVTTNIAVIRINSGGYGTGTVDFSGMPLGNYRLDFVIGGIKASDYGNDVWFNLGR